MSTDSNDEVLITRSKTQSWTFVVCVSLISALGGFLFGYDTGVISGAMIQLREHFNLSYFYQGLIVSISLFSAAVACFFCAILSDRFGRKVVILISSLMFTVGAVIMGLSYTKEALLVGRLLVGFGIGMASMSVPIYIAEIAPSHLRGVLVTVNNVFVTAGQVIASVIDGIFIIDKTNGWRYMLGLGGLPSAIQMFAFIMMPESPRWLVEHNRLTEARNTLLRIYGASTPTKIIEKELENMTNATLTSKETNENCDKSNDMSQIKITSDPMSISNADKGTKHFITRSTLVRMLLYPPTRKALFVGCGLQIFQQLVGINTVMYYSASIIFMAGIGGNDNVENQKQKVVWMAAVVAFANFFFGLFSPWFIKKFKRRFMLLCSLSGVFVSLILLAISFQLIASNSVEVTEIEPIPIDKISPTDDLNCSSAKTCDSCMRTSGCGFCYESVSNDPYHIFNGSCLPTVKDFSTYSAFGRCSNHTHFSKQLQWAYGYCPTSLGWLTLVGLILYLASFAPGMGPLPWTINSEIYPTWARSTGVATATSFNWITNIIVSLTFLSLTEAITRQGTYLLYSVVTAIALVFVYKYVPELGDQALEEIQEIIMMNA